MKWFLRAEDCSTIENLFLLEITPEIVNEIECDEEENYWKYRSYEQIREILITKYPIPFHAVIGLHTRGELMMLARFAWLLYWIGYEHIRIIIGKIEWMNPPIQSSINDLPFVPLRPNVRLTCLELFDEFSSPTTQFLDVRSFEEYSGQTTGYSYVRHAGRIPYFLFDRLDNIYESLPGDILWSELQEYLRIISTNHRMDSSCKRLIYMCGTGWRASLAGIFAEELHLTETITVLDSGWYEWSERFLTVTKTSLLANNEKLIIS